jgi:hypothetical protein
MRIIKLLLIPTILIACTSNPKEKENIHKDGLPQKKIEIQNNSNNISIDNADSVLIPSFEIEIVLSEMAKERLLNPKESIIAFAEFAGEPKDTISEGLNESGQLMLKTAMIEFYSPWKVKIENIFIQRKMYDRLLNKDFEVSVQIWTGRKTSEYNLLSGDLIYGPISKIKGTRQKLNAKLIKE